MMTLIIAYPHGDAGRLLNGTVGVVLPLHLPNFVPARKIEVLLAPLMFVSCSHYRVQCHLSNYSTPNEGLPESAAQC